MNVALGHGAKAYGWQETVTGIKSIVEAGSGHDGYLASVYGGLNTVASIRRTRMMGWQTLSSVP